LPIGAYVYGDYCTGEIFLFQNEASSLLIDTALNITSFGEDEAGEIYVVGQGGTVHRFGSAAPPPPPSFTIAQAIIRKRATGLVLDPINVRPNGKKFDIIVFEEVGATATQALANAKVIVNGTELDSEAATGVTGEPIYTARLKRFMLSTPGTLTVVVVRDDGARSNPLTLQIVP
jgi:hypothetical protein